jgi:Zn-dependent protease
LLGDAMRHGFSSESIRQLAAYLISLLFAIGLHEYAHARVATWCGDSTPKQQGRLSLNPLAHLDPLGTICILFAGFGWGRPVQINPYNFRNLRRDLMLTAGAGPLMNLLLATLGIALSWLVWGLHAFGLLALSGGAMESVILLLEIFVLLNLNLMAFNLIPVGPLDGVKIVQWFLPQRAAERFYNLSVQLGMPLLLVLMLFPPVTRVVLLPVRIAFLVLMPDWVGPL